MVPAADHPDEPVVVAAMTPCAWAACAHPAVVMQGWPMCRQHADADRRMRKTGDVDGEPMPDWVDAPFRHPQCGTNGGYHRHLRRREEACGPCRMARRGADRARKQVRV